MAAEHTPEPWGADFTEMEDLEHRIYVEVPIEQFNRAQACVMAAVGIPTKHLPEYFKLLDEGVTVNVNLRERNAKLVSVIKDFEEALRLVLNGEVDNANTPLSRVNQSLKEIAATDNEASLFINTVITTDENQEREIVSKELSAAAATAQEIRDNIKKKHKYYLGATDGNGDMVDVHDTPNPHQIDLFS